MAFRQPQRPHAASARAISFEQPEDVNAAAPAVTSNTKTLGKRTLEESQEWVLFSPAPASSAPLTLTSATERSRHTAELSRLSDFGSLHTTDLSDQYHERNGFQVDDDAGEQGEEEESEELDSLDDGLHAFHESSEHESGLMRWLDQSGGPVLPTHDGLGTFQASSAAVQEQLWQFEQYNPRPKHRRTTTSSIRVGLEALGKIEEANGEKERRERIESWRLEQSRALLEEIERETKRLQKLRESSIVTTRLGREELPLVVDGIPSAAENEGLQESFLRRFTQRVIRDLIGIDDTLLSVIFGEELVAEVAPSGLQSPDLQSAGRDLNHSDTNLYDDRSWEHRLLERIARELGVLIHQLSEHPGAFSTYKRTQETPYFAVQPGNLTPKMDHGFEASRPEADLSQSPFESQAEPVFAPTLPKQQVPHLAETSLWGIEEEPGIPPTSDYGIAAHHAESMEREREYWERKPDAKMVLNFLRNRFSSSKDTSPAPAAIPSTSNFRPLDPLLNHGRSFFSNHFPLPAQSAHRAALISHHHPLISRTAAVDLHYHRRRDSLHRHRHHHYHQYGVIQHALQRRPTSGSSCASQSTRKSRRSAVGSNSRNYWDIGASSVGSGQAAVGVGTWGEV